uniref:Myosin heavy chain n=1 Tax=Parascaris univalens TaxID=6257 RepID=A0A915A0V6_PARUN
MKSIIGSASIFKMFLERDDLCLKINNFRSFEPIVRMQLMVSVSQFMMSKSMIILRS